MIIYSKEKSIIKPQGIKRQYFEGANLDAVEGEARSISEKTNFD